MKPALIKYSEDPAESEDWALIPATVLKQSKTATIRRNRLMRAVLL